MELTIDESREDVELASLAREARGGASDAADRLASRVRDRIRRWAERLTRDADDAEDVAQDVLVKLHAGLAAEFEGRSRFTTWLYRVTRNVALDRKRTADRRAFLLAERATLAGAVSDHDAGSGAETTDDTDRLARLVRQCFEDLPRRQREVFQLSELEGRSSVEIAERLGIEPATVRVTLLKARRTIRAKMLAAHPRLFEEYTS